MKYRSSKVNILPILNNKTTSSSSSSTSMSSSSSSLMTSLPKLLKFHNLSLLSLSSSSLSIIIGLLSGFLSVIANVAGPLIAIYLINKKLSPISITGTRAIIFTLANMIKVPMHIINLNINIYNDIILIIILILISLISTYITKKYILPLINNKRLENICWILITIAAIFCLYD